MAICNLSNILTYYVRPFFLHFSTCVYPYHRTASYVTYVYTPPLQHNLLISWFKSHFCEAVYPHSQTGNWIPPPYPVSSRLTRSYCSISVTLMSRLMLNLHQTADDGLFTTEVTNTNVDYSSYYETPSILEMHAWTFLESLITLILALPIRFGLLY